MSLGLELPKLYLKLPHEVRHGNREWLVLEPYTTAGYTASQPRRAYSRRTSASPRRYLVSPLCHLDDPNDPNDRAHALRGVQAQLRPGGVLFSPDQEGDVKMDNFVGQ